MRAFICILALVSLSASAETPVDFTPLGAYEKRVFDSIGLQWYRSVQADEGRLAVGTVRIRFAIRGDGTIQNPRVISNTSDTLHAAQLALDAVRHAAISRPSPEFLRDDKLEIDIKFTYNGK
jgi:hypothetical protein